MHEVARLQAGCNKLITIDRTAMETFREWKHLLRIYKDCGSVSKLFLFFETLFDVRNAFNVLRCGGITIEDPLGLISIKKVD